MKLAATNGNKRNGIRGQRVTVTTDQGRKLSVTVPSGNALQRGTHREAIGALAYRGAINDMADLYGYQLSGQALSTLLLFARSRAARVLRKRVRP